MGCCGSAPVEAPPEQKIPVIQRIHWNKIPLGDTVHLPNVHKCELKQFKFSEKEKKATGTGDQVDDSNKWFCNGGATYGFIDGCKGGQKEFNWHETMSGWQCPDLDNCDFDLCEHCIRWIMHCVEDKIEMGTVKPKKNEVFGE